LGLNLACGYLFNIAGFHFDQKALPPPASVYRAAARRIAVSASLLPEPVNWGEN
jgi:hypothetical protein